MISIKHRNYVRAGGQLLRCIDNHRPGRLIFLIGVGGVGKTTLRRNVLRAIYGKPAHWQGGMIPCIEVMTLLAENSYFNSRGLAHDCLEQMFVPNIDWLIDDAEARDFHEGGSALSKSREVWAGLSKDVTEIKAWSLFRNNAKARGLKLLSLEHASAMCINHRDKSPAQHIMNIMSLTEDIGAMSLMTSIQNGPKLWEGRSEIRRRADVIWLAPYDVSIKEDRQCFLRMLKSICERYQFRTADLPAKLAPEIAVTTAAVCGEVVNLFDRAAQHASDAGRVEIIKSDIEQAYYPKAELETLWQDVREFWIAYKSHNPAEVSRLATEIWV
ncbi:hypothetical protein IP93_00697 [Lysobacter ruishenii]|uniref:Uncharacterized protein n=2 Tax=Aerolutibacter ruishenii TaxID=686800 RepID=A0A562M0R7_9GAMM|nr:hypothetical protein IP93_00697 [Lysobacter ruishenii]